MVFKLGHLGGVSDPKAWQTEGKWGAIIWAPCNEVLLAEWWCTHNFRVCLHIHCTALGGWLLKSPAPFFPLAPALQLHFIAFWCANKAVGLCYKAMKEMRGLQVLGGWFLMMSLQHSVSVHSNNTVLRGMQSVQDIIHAPSSQLKKRCAEPHPSPDSLVVVLCL